MADFRFVIFNVVLVDFAREAAPSTLAIFTFMVPMLLNFIQIKLSAAGTSSISSPFETHRTKFMVAMLSLLAFCCVAIGATQNYFPTHARKLRMAIKFSASLSVASLVSILLPKPWDHVPYIIYFFYFVGHSLRLIRNIFPAYYREHVAKGFLHTLRARQQQLPVTVRNINQPAANHGTIIQVTTLI